VKPEIRCGELPSPSSPPPGCAFQSRCPLAESICREKRPDLVEEAKGHWVACHMVEERAE